MAGVRQKTPTKKERLSLHAGIEQRTKTHADRTLFAYVAKYLIEQRLQQRLHGPVRQGAPEVGYEPSP